MIRFGASSATWKPAYQCEHFLHDEAAPEDSPGGGAQAIGPRQLGVAVSIESVSLPAVSERIDKGSNMLLT